ncbi:CFA70 protein, partial [Centropus bengalensis]|nr:CFA70 protein [Centropus bengalensis]
KSIKSDVAVTLVHVEYNGDTLGDSSRTDVLPDGTAEYNFTTSFKYSPDGPYSLDVIVEKPVLLTVTEVLQKDKKQKDKTAPLGQAVVDLLPLLQGQCSFKVSTTLHAVPTSPSESPQLEAKGSLEVMVCTEKPLLSAAQLSGGNILNVTLEAAYSVPEVFAPTAPPQNYMVCLQVPSAGEKEVPLLFKNGILKVAAEKEPLPRPKKWPLADVMAPGALNIPNAFIVGGSYEDEDGELNKREDRQFRIQAESTKKIVWDVEKRCYLDPAAVSILQKRIAECQYWPVEICRLSVASPSKGKTNKADKGDEEKQISFHGVAYVNMLPLLFPGVKQIRGAFRVFAYQSSEVFEKTKSQCSVFQDLRVHLSLTKEGMSTPETNTALSRAAASRSQKEDKEKITKDKDFNIRVRSREASCSISSVESMTSRARDGEQCLSFQQYVEAGTFLMMEIKLDKALVPKRPHEELARRVKEMIPPRPQLRPQTSGAKQAVEDYHKRIASIATVVLNEYHELFGKRLPHQGAIDHQTLEEQKHQLNFKLNSSGKYFAFKERLKFAVVEIVREKYLKTTAFESQEQFQAFLSELYVYLVDQMHVALNELLSEEVPAPPPPLCFTTKDQLLLFAREAEVDKDYKLASLFYQQLRETLAPDRQGLDRGSDWTIGKIYSPKGFSGPGGGCTGRGWNPHPWRGLKDGQMRCLGLCFSSGQTRLGLMISKAVSNLVILGLLLNRAGGSRGSSDDPSIVSPALSPLSKKWQREGRVGWGGRGLTVINSDELQSLIPTFSPSEFENYWVKSIVPFPTSYKIEAVQKAGLVNLCFSLLSASASSLFQPRLPPPGFHTVWLRLLSRTKVSAPACFRNKKPTLGLMETHFLAAPSPGSGLHQPPCSIFMKAAEFLMKFNAIQFAHMALAHELLSLEGGASCAYYLVLAQTHLLKEDLPKCNECLCEALKIDYLNPNVWAQKGHLCYLGKDFHEAKACYERTVSFVEDAADMHFVYLRLGSIYLEEKEYGRAKQTFLLACKDSASCLTWLGVGIACYRLGEMEEAEDALSEANALNNTNAEVWGYLTLVCLHGGRELEAEQCYKYARKLGLSKDALLQEIRATQHRLGFGDPEF